MQELMHTIRNKEEWTNVIITSQTSINGHAAEEEDVRPYSRLDVMTLFNIF